MLERAVSSLDGLVSLRREDDPRLRLVGRLLKSSTGERAIGTEAEQSYVGRIVEERGKSRGRWFGRGRHD
jgi:hypothetical protein